MLYLVSLSFAKSLSLSASNFQISSLKVGTILNPNVFISRKKFITMYISVPCAMEAPSMLLDNSLTGLVISGQMCLVRYNNVPTPDLYMDCVYPSSPGIPGVIVIFFFATLSPNCLSKLLIIVGCPNQAFLPSSLFTI